MKKNLLFLFLSCSLFSFAQNVSLLKESFESGTTLPKGWQIKSVAKDGGWVVGKPSVVGSTGMPMSGNTTNVIITNEDKCNCEKLEDLLILPKMNLKGKKDVFLSMNVYFGGRTDQNIKENAYIQYSKDAGTTWANVTEIEANATASGTPIWKKNYYDISSFNKDTAVWFAVKFTDNSGYLYGIAVDDVEIFERADVDASFKVATYKKYALKSNAVEVKGTIANSGGKPITSVEMTYKVGTTTSTKTVSGLNIAPFESGDISHPVNYNYAATGAHSFDVSISKVNGVALSAIASNFKTLVISKNVQRNVVFEEGTGTWCGWCPRGAVFMDSMASTYPKEFIGIAVHNGTNEPMKVVAYDGGLTKTPGFQGFPSVVVDRNDIIDPSEMFDVYDAARAELNPFTLSHKITYDSVSRKATITVKGSAAMTTKGDYRFNVVLSEDGVKGTTTGYAQTNYYANGTNGDMGGFEALPNPVPAKNMVYNHVGRALLGGGTYAGLVGSVPADIVEGKEYTVDFTYTVPANMKPANMHVVSMVLDGENGQILTGITDKLVSKKVSGTNDVFENNAVNVYPNPMSEEANIEISTATNVEVSVKVFNVMGQQVAARNYGKMSGSNILPFVAGSLPNGIYTVHIQMGDKLATKKVTIQK